jgi:hypothetical protein
MTSIALTRIYAYIQIITLPFKFFASELFMWNRDQLVWLMKVHRIAMVLIIFMASYLIGRSMIAQYRPAPSVGYEQQVTQLVREIDRQDMRLDRVQMQVNDINVQIARLASGQESLIKTMGVGMSVLGAISLMILGQFATYVVNLKMRREYGRLEKREVGP